MQRRTYEIATILPPSERFTPNAAGGISLFVNETTTGSAYHEHITVYGRAESRTRPFSDVRFKGIRPSMEMLFGQQTGYARAVVSHFKARPTGLIEVHNRVPLFHALRRAFSNTPISIHFHDDPLGLVGAKTTKQRWEILSTADAVYCCSDFIRRRFLTGLEAGRTDHVHVVYSGVDPVVRGRKEAFILYNGRLAPEKGALELAKAAATILPHFPKWKIVFVGCDRPTSSSKFTSYQRNVANALKSVGKQAVFLGRQPHDKVLELFARAAIAVVPTVGAEPFGRRAVEAMAAGAALVTSGHGGLLEAAGDAGVVVSPITPQGLGLALQGLMEDGNTLRAIQQQCFDRGSQFSLENARRHMDALRYNLLSQAYGG
jgi:UDP-glucose:(glucosyl)LPS alpha-1,2-glucosyltransferase